MDTIERRRAAHANQLAAAFVRFQMLGDHEAMHLVLREASTDRSSHLAFVTALAAIAGNLARQALGDEAPEYLVSLAHASAALGQSSDVDGPSVIDLRDDAAQE
jgi:hypothetical protein